MRHLIDSYIQAGESEKVSAFDDLSLVKLIVERGVEAVQALPAAIRKNKQAAAETIENNVRRLILDESPINPKYYEKMSVQVAAWGIKAMKTKWGTCNPQTRRIWLNLELAKKPPECLEYTVVHELVHLLVRHHDDRFHALMDRHFPRWRQVRRELNAAPLAHATWSYSRLGLRARQSPLRLIASRGRHRLFATRITRSNPLRRALQVRARVRGTGRHGVSGRKSPLRCHDALKPGPRT